ncbi:MAG: glycerophosphoryl diester phosphodiesterase membrane domain-containing protein [Polymorphobacter sp.]
MADAEVGLKPAQIWSATLAALRPDFWTLFAVAAPFTLLVDMVMALYGPAQPTTMAELTPRVVLILVLIPALIGAIGQLTVAHLVAMPGEPPRRALGAALAAWPAYVAVLLLSAFPTGLGFLLLIVPGLYIAARLFLVVPVAVLERPGALVVLRRSWELTDGKGWAIAWFLVLAVLFLLGASFLSAGVGAALASVLTLAGLKPVGVFVAALITAVLATVFAIASAAAATVVYLKVR